MYTILYIKLFLVDINTFCFVDFECYQNDEWLLQVVKAITST